MVWPKEVTTAADCPPNRRLRIITANVLTPNRNAKDLIRLVEQFGTDILVTLETDQWWQDQLDVLESGMPYTIKCPLDNLYGMHVYARLPLEQSEIAFLIEKDVPSMHTLVRLRSGDRIQIHFLHPAPPSPTENKESAERDAELIIVARRLEHCTHPVIVTGDLNDVAWSGTTRLFRKISGLLDPRVGRGMFNTFHARYPVLRWPLDHIFHSRHFTVCRVNRLPFSDQITLPLPRNCVSLRIKMATGRDLNRINPTGPGPNPSSKKKASNCRKCLPRLKNDKKALRCHSDYLIRVCTLSLSGPLLCIRLKI